MNLSVNDRLLIVSALQQYARQAALVESRDRAVDLVRRLDLHSERSELSARQGQPAKDYPKDDITALLG